MKKNPAKGTKKIMNRSEALEYFRDKDVPEALCVMKQHAQHLFRKETDVIFSILSDAFFSIVKKIVLSQCKIASIEYSVLLTRLIYGGNSLLIEAFDKNLFLGQSVATCEVDISFIFMPWMETREELKNKARKYMGLVLPYDAERIMLREHTIFTKFLSRLLIAFFEQELCISMLDTLILADEFSIWCGIYRSTAERVYYNVIETVDYGLFYFKAD